MKGPSSIRYGNAVAKAKKSVNHCVTIMIIMLDSYCGIPGFAKQIFHCHDMLDDCDWIRSYDLVCKSRLFYPSELFSLLENAVFGYFI